MSTSVSIIFPFCWCLCVYVHWFVFQRYHNHRQSHREDNQVRQVLHKSQGLWRHGPTGIVHTPSCPQISFDSIFTAVTYQRILKLYIFTAVTYQRIKSSFLLIIKCTWIPIYFAVKISNSEILTHIILVSRAVKDLHNISEQIVCCHACFLSYMIMCPKEWTVIVVPNSTSRWPKCPHLKFAKFNCSF